MRARLAEALGLAPEVNVKFTTNEGMGFVGRGEGIAALAVATAMGPAAADGPRGRRRIARAWILKSSPSPASRARRS